MNYKGGIPGRELTRECHHCWKRKPWAGGTCPADHSEVFFCRECSVAADPAWLRALLRRLRVELQKGADAEYVLAVLLAIPRLDELDGREPTHRRV